MADVQLERLIGGGAFGQVYRGIWQGTAVAVKILPILSSAAGTTAVVNAADGGDSTPQVPEGVLKAFEDEVEMFARLRHPNICLFLGACLLPPTRAIVTELVPRGSLWDVLRTPGLFEVSAFTTTYYIYY